MLKKRNEKMYTRKKETVFFEKVSKIFLIQKIFFYFLQINIRMRECDVGNFIILGLGI